MVIITRLYMYEYVYDYVILSPCVKELIWSHKKWLQQP